MATPQQQNVMGDRAAALRKLSTLQTIEEFERETDSMRQSQSSTISKATQVPTNDDAVSELFHRLSRSSKKPEFTFHEVAAGLFTASVVIGGESYHSGDATVGKKAAKEAAARSALQALRAQGLGTVIKREGIEPPQLTFHDSKQSDQRVEDWISLLYGFCQRQKEPRPYFEYSEHTPSGPFQCKITLRSCLGQVFKSEPCTQKSMAKAAAAKLAVIHLRESGKLMEQTQKAPKVNLEFLRSLSPPEAVNKLAKLLKIQPPRIEMTRSGGLVSEAAAYFEPKDTATEPLLRGAVGVVFNIFGQEKARRACYEQVLPVLEAIHNWREMEAGV